MKVSVIVPAYNAAGTICTVAEGLLGQTYRNMEIIIVDDGSKDNTADVLKPYGEALRLIRKENGGVSSARNRGPSGRRPVNISCLRMRMIPARRIWSKRPWRPWKTAAGII